jgi:AraC-like DNA-binding protein
MPKVFITNSDITKIPVVKLQKSDSIIMVKELLGDLRQDNSDNSTTSTYSTTFLLVGVLLFLLLFIVFRIKKRKKQHVQYPSEQQHQEEENTALIDSAEEEIDLSTDIEIISPENNELYSKLVLFYQDERPYLNANLKVIDVAKALNISPRTITAILKANGFNGFNNFNNKYRVEEVIRQFNDPNYLSIKMEAISSNAGFGNRQTFYNAFEEFTGFNPGYYRSEYLKQ